MKYCPSEPAGPSKVGGPRGESGHALWAPWALGRVTPTGRGEQGCREGKCSSLGIQRHPWQDAKRRAHRSNPDLMSLEPPVAEK